MCAMHSKLASGPGPLNLASRELTLPSAKFLQGLDSLNSESQPLISPSIDSLWIVGPEKLASEHKNWMWNENSLKKNILDKRWIQNMKYFQLINCNVDGLLASSPSILFVSYTIGCPYCLIPKKYSRAYELYIP